MKIINTKSQPAGIALYSVQFGSLFTFASQDDIDKLKSYGKSCGRNWVKDATIDTPFLHTDAGNYERSIIVSVETGKMFTTGNSNVVVHRNAELTFP